jgi:hypothetical protein
VSLALDLATEHAERLALTAHRGYPHDGRRLFGTADKVGQLAPRRVWVADFKLGGGTGPDAADVLQIHALALAAARLVGADEALVSILRLRSDGRWYTTHAELDAFALADVADRVRAIFAAAAVARADVVAGHLPVLHEGGWCNWCPVLPCCPQVTARVRQAAAGDALALAAPLGEMTAKQREAALAEIWAERLGALDAAQAGAAHERLKLAGEVVAAGEAALKDRARREPLPLSGGRVLREVPWGTRKVLSDAAKAELAALGEELERRGEVRRVTAFQVRAVARREEG